jgi:hypothetical protein
MTNSQTVFYAAHRAQRAAYNAWQNAAPGADFAAALGAYIEASKNLDKIEKELGVK